MISIVSPSKFKPPRVTQKSKGLDAFKAYDWYFKPLQKYLKKISKVFLVPCAATKPIHTSSMHKVIYQRFAKEYGSKREVLVVSEPVVLIRYEDLSSLEKQFCYDFPPKLLNEESRQLFVDRLASMLRGKDIIGCLPKHHASLINDAVGDNWKNYWHGDLYQMMKAAGALAA